MKYFPCKKSYLCQVFPLNLNNNRLPNLFTIDMKVFMGCHYIFNFDISAYVPSIHKFNLLGPRALTRITKMQIVICHYIFSAIYVSIFWSNSAAFNINPSIRQQLCHEQKYKPIFVFLKVYGVFTLTINELIIIFEWMTYCYLLILNIKFPF